MTQIDRQESRNASRHGILLQHAAMACALASLGVACDGGDGVVEPMLDEIPPAAPEELVLRAEGRNDVIIEWRAPADDDGSSVAAYELRVSDGPLDEGVFENLGTVVATGAPAVPGEAERVRFEGARPGVPVYVGIVAFDAAGNRSSVASNGAVMTGLDADGSVLPPFPDDGDNALGLQIEAGHLDDDGLADLAVSAPFKVVAGVQGAGTVYVYPGSADGLGATPSVTLEGTESLAQFGNGLAILDWNGDGVEDLAVGAPFGAGGSGRVYIFRGERLAPGSVLADTDADVTISADAASPWFGFSGIGFNLERARFDADERDDLIIGAAGADLGVGAFVILYGGTSAGGDITLSEVDANLMNGAVAEIFFAPGVAQNAYTFFSAVLANLGPGVDGTDQIGAAFVQGADAYVVRARASRPTDAGVYQLEFDPLVDLGVHVEVLDEDTFFATPMAAVIDMNDDGVREIALASYLEGDAEGAVRIISGSATGAMTASEATMVTIRGAAGTRFGSAIANNASALGASDIDGDGVEDMAIVSGSGNVQLNVWYGGQTFNNQVSDITADYTLLAPVEFTAATPANGGSPTLLRWAGDVDGDGQDDLVWSDWANNGRDGAIELVR